MPQCGTVESGQIMSAAGLLAKKNADRCRYRRGDGGNVCRCAALMFAFAQRFTKPRSRSPRRSAPEHRLSVRSVTATRGPAPLPESSAGAAAGFTLGLICPARPSRRWRTRRRRTRTRGRLAANASIRVAGATRSRCSSSTWRWSEHVTGLPTLVAEEMDAAGRRSGRGCARGRRALQTICSMDPSRYRRLDGTGDLFDSWRKAVPPCARCSSARRRNVGRSRQTISVRQGVCSRTRRAGRRRSANRLPMPR